MDTAAVLTPSTTMLALAIVGAAARTATALIFVLGAIHKYRLGAAFSGIVAAYRLLPAALVAAFAFALPLLELASAALLLWPRSAYAVLPAALLLTVMSGAVAINLLRGRSWIDCGCGTGRAEQLGNSRGDGDGEGLSWALVGRNAVLLALLLAAARPIPPALLGPVGAALALAAAATVSGFFYAATALAGNHRRWRLLTH